MKRYKVLWAPSAVGLELELNRAYLEGYVFRAATVTSTDMGTASTGLVILENPKATVGTTKQELDKPRPRSIYSAPVEEESCEN